jgi:hypothetical protein
LVCVRVVLSVCIEGWVNSWITSDRYNNTNNCLYYNKFFIYCLYRYANCSKGVLCSSVFIFLSFQVFIQLAVLLSLCCLFIFTASSPTLSAIPRSIRFSDLYDSRNVDPSMVCVEKYTYCLLRISPNLTISYWPTAVRRKYIAQIEFAFLGKRTIHVTLNTCCSILQKKITETRKN